VIQRLQLVQHQQFTDTDRLITAKQTIMLVRHSSTNTHSGILCGFYDDDTRNRCWYVTAFFQWQLLPRELHRHWNHTADVKKMTKSQIQYN